MTTLDRTVTRRTAGEYRVLYAKARPIVVSLAPGDMLVFRELGRRDRWTLPIATAFRIAVRAAAGGGQ